MVKTSISLGFVALVGSAGLPAFAQDPKDEPARLLRAVFVVPAPSVTVVQPVVATPPATAATRNRGDRTAPATLVTAAAAPRSGGLAFSVDVGAGFSWADDGDGDFDVEQDERVLYAAGHLELAGFVGWNVARGASWSFDLGLREHVSASDQEVIHRHQVALALSVGSAFCQLGTGLSVVEDTHAPRALYGFSFDGVAGYRLGDTGLYVGLPMGVEAFPSLPPVKTLAITLGYEML